MDKILEKFDELEKEIKDTNELQRCPDYCEGCVQCDFWKNFDELKSFFKKQSKQKSTPQEKTKDALSENQETNLEDGVREYTPLDNSAHEESKSSPDNNHDANSGRGE